MKRLLPLSLLALAVSAEAVNHRLAYSKAENVEVFVEHADNQPWCSPNLQLRFAFGGQADNAIVERLLPKLGGLLGSQCAIASQLSWYSSDNRGQRQASGKASQAGGWLSQRDTPAAAPAPAPPPASAPAPIASAPAPNAAPAEASASASPVVPAAAAAPVAPASATAGDSAPPPAVAASASTQPAEAAPSAPAVSQAAPAANAAPVPQANLDFAVSGWQPPLLQEAFAKADFLTEIQDQNGCRFRLGFQPKDAPSDLRAESNGVTCGPDGYAQGTGSLVINRRDGVGIHSFEGSFLSGLAIHGKAPQLPVVGFDKARNLLLRLHSEPASKVHYLLRIDYNSYYGTWNAGDQALVALTESRELFRDLESIRRVVDLAVTRLDQSAPAISSINFYAMRDLDNGLNQGKRDYWLYEIHLSRHWRTHQWEYNPQGATNHLFNFERKEAEQRRLAEEQRQREERRQRELLGQQAEQQLQLYRQLHRETRKPQELYQRILSDASYTPLEGGSYATMMKGDARSYSQIVHIAGKADDGWKVDYPYQAVLDAGDAAQAAAPGWFLIKGKTRLDTSRLDEQKLPLTLISASSLQACSEDGCADLRDPLKLTRHELGDPEWTPERAKELIKQAWPDRAATQGDDA